MGIALPNLLSNMLRAITSPITSLEAYRGAHLTKKNASWIPDHVSGDAAIDNSFDMLLRRIREMGRDDPVIQASKRAVVKHVIGSGILAFADALLPDSNQEYDDDFNDPSDAWFERWSDERECDIEGRFSFEEMQVHQWNEMMESGESLWLHVDDDTPGRSVRLAYQLLEAEQLDESRDWEAGGETEFECRRGIEYDHLGRPQFYWIFDAHPYGLRLAHSIESRSRRIPASRVIHTYLPNRTSEHRGVTWFTNLQSAKDLDWYLGNELTSKAIGSLFGVYFKRDRNAGSGTGLGGDSSTGNTQKLGAGIIGDLGPNDDIKIVEAKRGSADADPFIQLMLQLQAMSIGVSKLRLTGDYSQSSYTSARAAHLDDATFFLMLQNFARHNFVRPIRRSHQRQAVAAGLIKSMTPRQYLQDQMRLENFFIQPPGREQIDPEKETNAAAARVRFGFSTHAEECGKRGKHWRKVARQRAREENYWTDTVGRLPDLGESKAYLEEYSQRSAREEAATATQTAGSPA
jgi:lambda family phage portal protein